MQRIGAVFFCWWWCGSLKRGIGCICEFGNVLAGKVIILFGFICPRFGVTSCQVEKREKEIEIN